MWSEQAACLRGRGFHVLTPNLPGFGDRPALPPERTTMEAFAADIRECIQREAGGRAIVGGFSMGGYVLLALLREAPECVAAALFVDTRADADSYDARKGRYQAIDQIRRDGPAGFFDASLTRMMRKRPDEKIRAAARAMMERQSVEGILAAQTAMTKRRDQTDLLAELTMPVMVLVGAEDAITPPSVALNMQSHMPHAMVVQVVSAGHLAPMEQPAAVSGHMETFLATAKRALEARP